MNTEILSILGKWLSIAVILALTLYGTYDIWRSQMVFQQEITLKLIEAKTCTNIDGQ